jgi:hypothetical protein
MILHADIWFVLQQSENGIRFFIQINVKANDTSVLSTDSIVYEEYKLAEDNKI